jgi:hypothetical protein
MVLREEARKIADNAKSKGLWLFDPTYNKWYSPEDFKHIYSYANANDERLQRLEMRQLCEGIEAGFKRLTEIHSKLEAFINFAMEYYKR